MIIPSCVAVVCPIIIATFYRNRTKSLENAGNPWKSMEIHGNPLTFGDKHKSKTPKTLPQSEGMWGVLWEREISNFKK